VLGAMNSNWCTCKAILYLAEIWCEC